MAASTPEKKNMDRGWKWRKAYRKAKYQNIHSEKQSKEQPSADSGNTTTTNGTNH